MIEVQGILINPNHVQWISEVDDKKPYYGFTIYFYENKSRLIMFTENLNGTYGENLARVKEFRDTVAKEITNTKTIKSFSI
jgi:hypothetical protein